METINLENIMINLERATHNQFCIRAHLKEKMSFLNTWEDAGLRRSVLTVFNSILMDHLIQRLHRRCETMRLQVTLD